MEVCPLMCIKKATYQVLPLLNEMVLLMGLFLYPLIHDDTFLFHGVVFGLQIKWAAKHLYIVWWFN